MTKHKNAPKQKMKSKEADNATKTGAVEESLSEVTSESVQTKETNSDENELNAIEIELESTKSKADKNWDLYLRANADLENARRRAQQDVEKARKYGLEKLIEDLLPIKDSVEMGLAATHTDNASIEKLQEGSELILKMFSDTMEKHGIETIDPIGKRFDPEQHQAMSLQESKDDKPNTVITVMQKGYSLNGRLIRPAMVIVAKKPSQEQSVSKDKDETVGTNVDEKA